MAYGRRYPTRASRSAPLRNRSGVAKNTAVSKVYKARRKPKTLKAANKTAITVLAKQVKKLAAQDEGDIQYQYQRMNLYPDFSSPIDMTQMPEEDGALGFCANNFYDVTSHSPCRMYKGNVNNLGVPVFVASNNVGTTTSGTFTKEAMQPASSLLHAFQWQAMNASQTVSATEYMPLSARYNFVFSGSAQTNPTDNSPIRFRVTFFKFRPSAVRINTSVVSNVSCPTNLGAYWRMCRDQPTARNYFSKNLHQIVSDKWFVIKRPEVPRSAGQAGQPPIWEPTGYDTKPFRVSHSVTIPHKHLCRGKTIRPNFAPGTQPSHATFNTNVPLSEQLWCIISCNMMDLEIQSPTSLLGLQIEISRSLRWRDKHGTATF